MTNSFRYSIQLKEILDQFFGHKGKTEINPPTLSQNSISSLRLEFEPPARPTESMNSPLVHRDKDI